MLAKNNMAGLLSAEREVIAHHILVYILIAYRRLLILKACLVARLVKSQIGHDRRNDRIIVQTAVLLHVFAADVEDQVSVYLVTVLINRNTSVRITVVREAYVQLLLLHILLEHFYMRGSAVRIDIRSVRLAVDYIGLRTQCVIYALGNGKCASVRAV